MGWGGMGDAVVLNLCDDRFDVLLTLDRRIAVQRTIPSGVAVVLVRPRSSHIKDLLPFLARIRVELDAPQRGKLVVLEPP
jgi:hypothetical protein